MLYEILLKRLLGGIALTFKELSTLLTQAKVCLNFYPQTALSNDQNDLTCLGSELFLIGASLCVFLSLTSLLCSVSLLSRRKQL